MQQMSFAVSHFLQIYDKICSNMKLGKNGFALEKGFGQLYGGGRV